MSKLQFSINMMYWKGQDPARDNNAKFCWHHLKKFVDYAKSQKLNIDVNFFDFSESKPLVPEAIHLPTKRSGFRRTEKDNQVIDYIDKKRPTPDIFSLVDSDIYIPESEYPLLVSHLKTIKLNHFYVSQVWDIKSTTGIDFKNFTINLNKITAEPRVRITLMDLGGLFFAPFWSLIKLGGFDERLSEWGGEDNVLGVKMQNSGVQKAYIPVKLYHLPHISLGNEVKQEKAQQMFTKEMNHLHAQGIETELAPHLLFHILTQLNPQSTIIPQIRKLSTGRLPFEAASEEEATVAFISKHFCHDLELINAIQHQTLSQNMPLLLMRFINCLPLHHQIADAFHLVNVSKKVIININQLPLQLQNFGNKLDIKKFITAFIKTLENFNLVEQHTKPDEYLWSSKLSVPLNSYPALIKEYTSFHHSPETVCPQAFSRCFTTMFLDLSNLEDAIDHYNGQHWQIVTHHSNKRLRLK